MKITQIFHNSRRRIKEDANSRNKRAIMKLISFVEWKIIFCLVACNMARLSFQFIKVSDLIDKMHFGDIQIKNFCLKIIIFIWGHFYFCWCNLIFFIYIDGIYLFTDARMHVRTNVNWLSANDLIHYASVNIRNRRDHHHDSISIECI